MAASSKLKNLLPLAVQDPWGTRQECCPPGRKTLIPLVPSEEIPAARSRVRFPGASRKARIRRRRHSSSRPKIAGRHPS